jgi:hypothetical protein
MLQRMISFVDKPHLRYACGDNVSYVGVKVIDHAGHRSK